MPRKPCYWTRRLELDLVEFVRQRDFIWKPIGNTNHHIQQKYKAYAEFAATLGRGFTARSVRDRWVNIRSTYNHNLRRVNKSRETARTQADVYVPCWPLWKPLQFLRSVPDKDDDYEGYPSGHTDLKGRLSGIQVKEESHSDADDTLTIRQRGQRTDRPRWRPKVITKTKNSKCKRVIEDLVKAMKPLRNMSTSEQGMQSYWFFGKHVTERLNCMSDIDAKNARCNILKVLEEFDGAEDLLSTQDVDMT
ncbi:uncharacterized protein LOC126375566 [Pectinophora gossypiella]|uniref:uncharacterized protein LOC126375566 n=1 Tax=Pectinophora gossypiella TaxID=13191 RepID=UPI00214F3AC7|nr:uncharacterized protein LOC126375566 [Pectinophora gossypiella]